MVIRTLGESIFGKVSLRGTSKLTTITKAETTYAEEGWRWSAGGRVLTFNMMLEVPVSPKVSRLVSHSKVLFEETAYLVNHTEVIGTSPKTIRIALNRI